MSLNSSRAKTGIEAMEDLFTLGQFEEAYELGETEIIARLAARRLPRVLLQSRQAVAPSAASLDPSGALSTQRPLSTSANAPQGPGTSTLTSSTSLSNSTSSSRGTSDSSLHARSLDQRQAYPTGFGPHDADGGHLATSSSPFVPHAKPRDITYSSLAPSDQEQLRLVVLESVPYLAVMVQCLFELNERATIPPLLKRLCGSQVEEYPFELAYLLINLYVSQKDYDQARPACEAMISQIRSLLGPIPLTPRSNILSASYEAPTTELAGLEPNNTQPKSKPGSENFDSPNSSPSSVPGPSPVLMDEEHEEEDEAVSQLRHDFQSLLQLYIFHVLCETQRFADAKLFLFLESRLHPNVIQEWSVCIDELEQQYLEECKRIQEQRNAEASQDNRFLLPAEGVASNIRQGGLPSKDGPSVGARGSLNISGPSGPNNLKTADLPLHHKLLGHFLTFYEFVRSRFNSLSPLQKAAFAALIVAFVGSLAALLSTTQWARKMGLYQWISERLGGGGRPSKLKAARRQNGPAGARMGYYGPTTPTRGTLGANRAALPPSYSAPAPFR